jgi:hypothetical protein
VSEETKTPDESAIERVLAALEAGSDAATPSALPEFADLDEEAQTLGRLYVEAVGLYPHGAPPAEVPAELKSRVFDAIRAERARPAAVKPEADVAPVATMRAPSRSGARSVDQAFSTGGHRPVPPMVTAAAARRPSRWPLALAATFTLAFAGLAGWLFVQLEESRSQQVRLEGRLRSLNNEVLTLRTSQEELVRTRETIQMVTTRGAAVCSLRSLDTVRAAAASGVMFVDATRSRWYLVMNGLEQIPSEREYQLWFLVDGRPVSGGTFSAQTGHRVELSAASMPAGANAVAVTIEPRGGLPLPTGPMVLLGDQIQSI